MKEIESLGGFSSDSTRPKLDEISFVTMEDNAKVDRVESRSLSYNAL